MILQDVLYSVCINVLLVNLNNLNIWFITLHPSFFLEHNGMSKMKRERNIKYWIKKSSSVPWHVKQGTAVRWSATNKVQSCLWQFIIIKSFRKSNTCSSSWSQACFKQRWVNCLLHWNWASNWLKWCHWFWFWFWFWFWSTILLVLLKKNNDIFRFVSTPSFFLIETSPLYLSMTSQGLGL